MLDIGGLSTRQCRSPLGVVFDCTDLDKRPASLHSAVIRLWVRCYHQPRVSFGDVVHMYLQPFPGHYHPRLRYHA